MNNKTVIITEENINNYKFFITTKDIEFADGSKVKKGTEFMIEDYKDKDNFHIHFCKDERNYYVNETGEDYYSNLEQIRSYAKACKVKSLEHERR